MLINRSLAVAPMLDWTDRHFRWFVRRITRRTLLYTEMVTTGALLHGGDRERFLGFDDDEHPVALQLGGSDLRELAISARLGAERGYDEINLNVGCPSDRVQSGRFGACLMAEPALVADCVRAMRDAVGVSVTVKHRIGIDERDSYEALCDFVGTVAAAGCDALVVHARKAWLSGLSPKENRTVPPLRYDVVHRLKRDFPGIAIVINGGIESLDAAQAQLEHVDGVMLGRAAYHDPWVLAGADKRIFGAAHVGMHRPAATDAGLLAHSPEAQWSATPGSRREVALTTPLARPPVAHPWGTQVSRREVAEAMLPYLEEQAAAGVPVSRITRHLLGLFHGVPGARVWRRALSGSGEQTVETYRAALARLPP
jgi:tRNA-dihydrouridine synthase A